MRARSVWRGGRKSNVSDGGKGFVSVLGRTGVCDDVEGWRLCIAGVAIVSVEGI